MELVAIGRGAQGAGARACGARRARGGGARMQPWPELAAGEELTTAAGKRSTWPGTTRGKSEEENQRERRKQIIILCNKWKW